MSVRIVKEIKFAENAFYYCQKVKSETCDLNELNDIVEIIRKMRDFFF